VNIKCTHSIDGIDIPTGRLVKFRAFKNEIVLAPDWCPILMEEREKERTETSGRLTPKRWNRTYAPTQWDMEKKLKPLFEHVNLDDIKVGDKYMIPPFAPERRHTVIVKEVSSYSVECEVIGEPCKRTIYLYKDGIKIRLIKKVTDEDA